MNLMHKLQVGTQGCERRMKMEIGGYQRTMSENCAEDGKINVYSRVSGDVN